MAEELGASRDLTAVSAPLSRDEEVAPNSFARRGLGGLHPAYVLMLVPLIVVPFAVADIFPFGVSLATSILVLSIFTMSLDLLLCYQWLPSFGHRAFMWLGAYATAV